MNRDVVVVIGIGGMGAAIARRQGAGRKVMLADFNRASVEALSTEMSGEGYDVEGTTVDVSSRDSLGELAARAQALGPVRQVVHTAGLSPTQASAEAILAVDLAGVAYSLDAFGEVIAEGGAGVVIASMSAAFTTGRIPPESEAALRSTASEQLLALPFLGPAAVPDAATAYALAKRANQVRVEAASSTWGKRGARVNTVSPGIIATPMGHQELAGESGSGMQAMIDASATARIGTPGDISDAVAFLLGPDASFITGTDLLVDGGVVAAARSGAIPFIANASS